VEEMETFSHQEVPLGKWAVNSLRWVLRRHHLVDDEPTRAFLKYFIHSSWNVYTQFTALVEESAPQAVVLFNGMFYPEAAARYVCLQKGSASLPMKWVCVLIPHFLHPVKPLPTPFTSRMIFNLMKK